MSNALKFHIAVSLLNNLLECQLLSSDEYKLARLALTEQYDIFF